MDKKLFFVAIAAATSECRCLYEVDIRGGIMMLNQKMARGMGAGTPLVSEIVIEKVMLKGEKILFVGKDEAIECTLVAAFFSRGKAERCYEVDNLKPADARWYSDTVEVLESFERISEGACSFRPIALVA